MPELHRENGFVFMVYAPPREHGPAHVHVHKSGTEAVLRLGDERTPVFPLRVSRMSRRDVLKAVRMAQANKERFLTEWENLHGA